MTAVCFYEAFEEEQEMLRHFLPAEISAIYTDRTIQESGHETPQSRLISVRTQSLLPTDWSHQLDGIISRSTGYDHLVAYASRVKEPLALGYLPLYCHRAVAEHALLLWMALRRRLKLQLHQFSKFHRDGLTGSELKGKTLVVVGVGHIGYEVCRIGQALEMRVLGVDVNQNHKDIEFIDIEDALPQADVLVCAMDLNDSNRGYFNLDKWSRIKRGAIFVNISRGELSPSTILLQALQEGYLGGIGLDAFDHEAILASSLRTETITEDPEVIAAIELSNRLDCLCTPHNAFNSQEAVIRKSEHTVMQIVHFLRHNEFLWNIPSP